MADEMFSSQILNPKLESYNPYKVENFLILKSMAIKSFCLKPVVQNQPHMAIQLNNFSLWEVLPCCENFQFVQNSMTHWKFLVKNLKN